MTPVLFIGEAWGVHEQRLGAAFVGPSGAELFRMSSEAGLINLTTSDRDYIREFYRTGDPRHIDMVWRLHPEIARANVFNLHPPGNEIDVLCGPRVAGLKGWPALMTGKYLLPEYAYALDDLQAVIEATHPNLIITLGNTPLWATCGVTKISRLRGTTRSATRLGAGCKVLPVYHPAAVLRQWSLRPLTILDLTKAAREKEFPDVRRPRREVWIEPSIDDILKFRRDYIDTAELLSVDIETSGTRVTCIGFSPRPDLALVIPFDDSRAKGGSFYVDANTEARVWSIIRSILGDRRVPKLFQNGLYDIAFLWRAYGIPTLNAAEDTMLCHHALQPESVKGLGFLGSVYTDEGPWKTERRVTTIKSDE